ELAACGESAAEFEVREGRPECIGDLAGMDHGQAVDFGEGFGVEALRAGEHMEAPPVYSSLNEALDYRGHAVGVHAEGAGDAAHRHSARLDGEGRRHPNRDLGLDADALRSSDRSKSLAFALDANGRAGLDRFLELQVELAGAGEVHRDASELRLLQA